jgi:hypothetical protein
MPQLFPERASVVAEDWLPSVRVSSGVDLARWSRFLSDRLYTVARVSPELRRVAAQIVDAAGGARAKIPEAIITWVNQHIEPEASLFEPATVSLDRGQGNRAALVMALARALGLEAELMFVRRSWMTSAKRWCVCLAPTGQCGSSTRARGAPHSAICRRAWRARLALWWATMRWRWPAARCRTDAKW